MRGLRLALGLVGVFGLAAAAMAEPKIYVGGGVGMYNLKIDGGGSSYTPPDSTGTAELTLGSGAGDFEDSAAVWRVFVGYQAYKITESKWMPLISLQADYNWYGTTNSNVPPAGQNGCRTNAQCQSYKVNGDSWELSVRPSWAITNWLDLFGRIGYNWYNVDVKPRWSSGQSDSNDAVMYSGGLAFNLSENVAIFTEYEVVDIDDGDLDTATINLVYKIPR